MLAQKHLAATGLLMATLLATGCSFWRHDQCFKSSDPCREPHRPPCGPSYLEIDEPCPDVCLNRASASSLGPDTVRTGTQATYWDLSLEEAVQLALQRTEVLRDLGATVLRAPGAARTWFEPSIVNTDPRFGEEAALSDFDATLAASALWEDNDRVFNNTFLGSNGILVQDLGSYNVELRKRAATGTQMALRHVTDYDFNNFVGNRFGTPSGSWTTYFDLEVRQPLWQGAGTEFNRIAGPNGRPGAYNGVLLARIRTDMSLAEFEAGVRDLVSNVENAYWDLFFTYYDLEAKKSARDQALALLNVAKVGSEAGDRPESDALQAEEQYWRFESDVQDSLYGRLIDGTRTDNGAAGGAFRSTGGVRVAERRLRLIIGLPITTGELIRPITNPVSAPIAYDWATCSTEALGYRPELRRQRWEIKRREMELLASKNFLKPRLDLVGRVRQRGFGESLVSQSNTQFSSAFGNLADGNNEEWQLGVELEVPLGFRRASTTVRNAELTVAREVAVLYEQEQQVLFGLSNAVGDVERSYQVMQAQYNRLAAAEAQVEALSTQYSNDRASIDVVLDAQRRKQDSQTRYRQAQAEYMLALKNVHFEKGTLLEHDGVYLAESGAPRKAYADADARRESRWKKLNYVSRDPVVSRGPAPSGMLTSAAYESVSPTPAVPILMDGGQGGGTPIEVQPVEASPIEPLPQP